MRPKNVGGTKWLIHRESWYPHRKDAEFFAKKQVLPYDIEHVPNAKTMFGNYRKDTWRLRTYALVIYKGFKVQTGGMSLSRAKEVAKYHKGRKLIKVRKAYYYI
jgi:hypothetical protein